MGLARGRPGMPGVLTAGGSEPREPGDGLPRLRRHYRARGTASWGDRWWKKQRLWAIVTSNPNSWTTAEEKVLPATAAGALLLQETKLCGPTGGSPR